MNRQQQQQIQPTSRVRRALPASSALHSTLPVSAVTNQLTLTVTINSSESSLHIPLCSSRRRHLAGAAPAAPALAAAPAALPEPDRVTATAPVLLAVFTHPGSLPQRTTDSAVAPAALPPQPALSPSARAQELLSFPQMKCCAIIW